MKVCVGLLVWVCVGVSLRDKNRLCEHACKFVFLCVCVCVGLCRVCVCVCVYVCVCNWFL